MRINKEKRKSDISKGVTHTIHTTMRYKVLNELLN